jgi:phosphoadenosine phosphosulfate reductase
MTATVSALRPPANAGQAVASNARHLPGYEARVASAVAVLREAAQAHAGRIVQATSLGAEDMVVTDLIARHGLGIPLATLDTGVLHAETLALLPRIRQRYGLEVERFSPPAEQVLHFVAQRGERVMYESLEGRKACCALRKLEPLARLLGGPSPKTAWVTGLRREQSADRGHVDVIEADGQCRSKINPLADWAWGDVWRYIEAHEVPYNPLHDAFFPSIGCAPCTRAVALGEDFRAGRWWWEQAGVKECGLHVHAELQRAAPPGANEESPR